MKQVFLIINDGDDIKVQIKKKKTLVFLPPSSCQSTNQQIRFCLRVREREKKEVNSREWWILESSRKSTIVITEKLQYLKVWLDFEKNGQRLLWEGTQKYYHTFSQLNALRKQKTFIKLQVKTNQLDESQARIKIARRNINNFRYTGYTTRMGEREEELKSLLKVKEESEKAGLKFNVQKTKIMASGPITSWQIQGGEMETVTDFIFLGSKITVDSDCSHEIKRCLLVGKKICD